MRKIRVTNPFYTNVTVEGVVVKSKQSEIIGSYNAEKASLVSTLKRRGFIVKVVDVTEETLTKEEAVDVQIAVEAAKVEENEVTESVEEVLDETAADEVIEEAKEPVAENLENTVENEVSEEAPKVDKVEEKPATTGKKQADSKKKNKKENTSSKKA